MRVVFFVIALFITRANAQLPPGLQEKTDSLNAIVETARHDTIKIKAWQEWDDLIYLFDPEMDFELNKKIEALSATNLQGKPNRSERKFFLAARSGALNVIGSIHYRRGEFDVAKKLLNESVGIKFQIGDKKGAAFALNNLGNVYRDQGNLDQAIDYYSRSLKIKELLGDSVSVASSLSNIGLIYEELGELERSKEFLTRSMEVSEKLGDDGAYAIALTNLGNIYHTKAGEDEKALECYKKALEIHEAAGDKYAIAYSLINFGAIYFKRGEYDSALYFYTRGMQESEAFGDKKLVSHAMNNIGDIYRIRGQLNLAVEYGSKSLELAKEVGSLEKICNASLSLWQSHRELGHYKQALEMYELYNTFHDSILSQENHQAVIRQGFKYEYEKQAEADSLKAVESAKVKDAQLAAGQAENYRRKQQSYYLFAGLGLAILFGGFIFSRFRITQRQRRIIENQKLEVDHAYLELGEKNQEILDSINYARRIQNAILPPDRIVRQHLKQSFILYKPKDIVAGDFYWLQERNNEVLFAAADCTGHGVPGAMVSVVCNNGLNRSVREFGLSDPGKILDKTREIVIQEFEKSEDDVKDGMDISMCALKGNQLKWAGANNPLWLIRNHELIEYKPDKQPIGKYAEAKPFTVQHVELRQGDTIYIFTDGYSDQFGGERGKKFKAANLKQLLLSINAETMERQCSIIHEAFEKWRGKHEQVDDVCVIGVRI
jgi:tetratricopeptide (TPR) repeat protein